VNIPANKKVDIPKKCGNCLFCSRCEIYLPGAGFSGLQNVARDILNAKPGPALLKSEKIIDMLVVLEKLQSEKVYCHRERCWTHFMDIACSFWQPRKNGNVPTT